MELALENVVICLITVKFTPLCLFHLAVAAVYFAGLYGHFDILCKYCTGAPDEFAGFCKYLTYWNLVFHFMFFILSTFIDFITPECGAYDSIMRIRDSAFAGIVFPYGMFVFLMFWGMYFHNRNQIFREEDEQYYPTWLNHISHTVGLPIVLLEVFLTQHQFPSRVEGYALTASFGSAYILWILYLGFARDIWVYIFLKEFNWSRRIIFVIMSFIFTFILYMIGEAANYLFVGDSAKQP